MTTTPTPIFPQTIVNGTAALINATGTTVTSLLAAGTNGTKVESLTVTSTDTANRDLNIYAVISATNYLLGCVQVPATSGSVNSVVTVDILRAANFPGLAYDANGNKYLYLASGTTLSVAAGTAVTTAKQITVFAQGGNF